MTFILAAILIICYAASPPGWGLAPTAPLGSELISHLFVHKNLEHLAANLLVLVPFGWWFERRRGATELLALLAIAGSLSAYAEIQAHPTYPGVIVGCSGAVSALLGAFGRFERWAFLITVPVLLAYSLEALDPNGSNADWAHLAGLGVGLLWAVTMPSPKKLRPPEAGDIAVP